MIDIHSHILPGVDDGARNFDEAIEIAKWLVRQGVTDLVATPHYIVESDFMSPRADNLKLLNKLQHRLDAAGVKLRLYLGNEIYINKFIDRLVEAEEISPLANSKYLLVELPLHTEFSNYEGYLCDLNAKGYQVILAHPERYEIIQEDYQKARDLYEDGVLLQCNLRSVVGHYGKEAERVVKRLARDKMIFTFGSDTHRVGSSYYLVQAQKKLTRYYNPRELSILLSINMKKVLNSGF